MRATGEDLWLPHTNMCEHINMLTNTTYINYIYMLLEATYTHIYRRQTHTQTHINTERHTKLHSYRETHINIPKLCHTQKK